MEKIQTVFKKVMVKDRLPIEEKKYDTSHGCFTFFPKFNKWRFDLDVQWWLEEIELPSEDDIKEESVWHSRDENTKEFIEGANYILNKLS